MSVNGSYFSGIQKTRIGLLMSKVILETCYEKRHHSPDLIMSQYLNVKRWAQTI